MSGRSAYVRKKITETKKAEATSQARHAGEDVLKISELPSPPLGREFSKQGGFGAGASSARLLRVTDTRDVDVVTPLGQRRESIEGKRLDAVRPLDDFAYARARKPHIKTEDLSGIAKSGVRSAYDKKTEDVRKGLAKAFSWGKKSKRGEVESPTETRPESGATMRPTLSHHTDDSSHSDSPHPSQVFELPAESDAGPPKCPPPTSTLPPIPQGPQIWRWIGTGRPIQRWNKLRKDPELWDPNGDVLVYLTPKGQQPKGNPSLRLSSHIIEATESRQLITMLREGFVDYDDEDIFPLPRRASTTSGATGTTLADGQISYEIYFPPPSNANRTDQLKYHITTRNVFAMLCHVSLVGLSLHQALMDLHQRLDEYSPPSHVDNLLTIMSYISARGLDDVRNDPETAIGLLAWSEEPKVRWEEAWRETFVHAAGLYGTSRGRAAIDSCVDFKSLSPITRALLERASLETQLRLQVAEERLATFAFDDMWPTTGSSSFSPATEVADRLQQFFLEHYQSINGGRWPPPLSSNRNAQEAQVMDSGEATWLTRTVTQSLQKDFGALYDYLVNRDIVWDVSETRPSRKWLMVSETGNKGFEADTPDLPITDMLIEFDNKQRYPHIPHPYPLVPESIPLQHRIAAPTSAVTSPTSASSGGSMNFLRRNKPANEPEPTSPVTAQRPSAAVERRVHLAYTESTNIYILGSDFSQSDLIDAYVKFEKADHIGEIDPSLARRARWVLIYGILQTLASVAVDAPNVRYHEGVPYHLSPQLKGARIPPWSKKTKHTGNAAHNCMEASHELSYCWQAQLTWTASNTSASEEDGADEDDLEDESDLRSPILFDHDKLNYGFPYPPPLAFSTRQSQGSSGGGSSTRVPTAFSMSSDGAHSDAGHSTVTTSAASTLPMSPLSRDGSLKHHAKTGRSKTARHGLTTTTTTRSRIDESSEGDWSPVNRVDILHHEQQQRRPRRDGSRSSDATSSGGLTTAGSSRRRRRHKNMDDLLDVQGIGSHVSSARSQSRSPTTAVAVDVVGSSGSLSPTSGEGQDSHDEEVEDLKAGQLRAQHYHHHPHHHSELSRVGPMILDFDELDVDDIMPH